MVVTAMACASLLRLEADTGVLPSRTTATNVAQGPQAPPDINSAPVTHTDDDEACNHGSTCTIIMAPVEPS